ncbi:LamG domain-containing protein [Streptomyces sp. NPDC059466]|uniref:LamG domain-containing protein n=1 Tax=unclassified Streptomyces TaxID=2593676 RepID=UPI003688DE9A
MLASSVAVVAVPWTAVAAENRAPSQPELSELTTGSAACASGEARSYVRTRPTLGAVVRDPDAEPVSARFEASWTDGAGERQVRTADTGSKASGSVFRWTVPDDVPAFTEVSWRVRGFDGKSWGPWSSDGERGSCAFVYDTEAPAKPSVSSPEYPDDTQNWHDGVGAYGTFTVDSTSDDVESYLYTFLGERQQTVRPAEPGGPVVLRWMPRSSGVKSLSVQAVDRAGNVSAPLTHQFRVASGRTPVAAWKLADAAGSTQAAAEAGGRAATAGGGVSFGAAGPARTAVSGAVELDGSADAYLTTGAPAVDTAGAFAVSAWVRPDALGGDGMTAVGQDGDGVAAFGLGEVSGADGGRTWSFAVGGDRVRGGAPETGEWAHLAGVYDPVAGTARLYVNGVLAGTAEGVTVPGGTAATGGLRIGRPPGTGGNWHGALADVRVWDRVVVDDEVAAAAKRAVVSKGYWELDEAADGGSPERDGGAALRLGGDATIRQVTGPCDPLDPDCVPGSDPIAGTGDLALDGDGDFAATDGATLDTGDSFSVAAQVLLDDAAQDRTMTVLSLPGEHGTLASVRYSGELQRWQMVLAEGDATGAETTTVTAENAPAYTGWVQHVALVYDDGTDEIRLYVDGQLSARTACSYASKVTGALQVGRSLTADGWGEYAEGRVDEVHAYAGALTQTEIAQLAAGATDV